MWPITKLTRKRLIRSSIIISIGWVVTFMSSIQGHDRADKAPRPGLKVIRPNRDQVPQLKSAPEKTNKAAIRKCLPSEIQLQKISVEKLKKRLFASDRPITQEEHWRNYHLETPQGEVLIVRLDTDQNRNQQQVKKLKLFKEDQSGLPWPQQLDEEEIINPGPQTLKKYLGKGKIFYQDRVFTLQQKTISATFHTDSHGISEFQIQRPDSFLDCQSGDSGWRCHCI